MGTVNEGPDAMIAHVAHMNWPDALVSVVLIVAITVIWLAYLWLRRG